MCIPRNKTHIVAIKAGLLLDPALRNNETNSRKSANPKVCGHTVDSVCGNHRNPMAVAAARPNKPECVSWRAKTKLDSTSRKPAKGTYSKVSGSTELTLESVRRRNPRPGTLLNCVDAKGMFTAVW